MKMRMEFSRAMMLFAICMFLFSCKEDKDYISIAEDSLVADVAGGKLYFNVSSNTSWVASAASSWVSVGSPKGSGDLIIGLTVNPNYSGAKRSTTISVTGESAAKTIELTQDTSELSVPVLQAPANASTGIDFPVTFSWKAPEVLNSRNISYMLYLSENEGTWGEALYSDTNTEVTLAGEKMKEYTLYYWKVIAKDEFGSQSESEVCRFTSGERLTYKNGEVVVYQTYSAPDASRPVNLVFLGDGFVETDYTPGGTFDTAVDKAVDAFFSVEPYPSYREYFTVYKVVAYSEESGASVLKDFKYDPAKKQKKNTVFNCELEGGTSTGIDCDYNTVFDYAMKVPAITEEELENLTVILIINLDVYAGTAMLWSSGRGLAMCPTGDTFEEIVYHEGSGHAFAKLYDEYIYNPHESFPPEEADRLEAIRQGNAWNFGANLSLTNNRSNVHWKHYFEKEGYEMVDMYEGGNQYGKDIWRPEKNSCMNDNVPYFNAPSREAIVRRIMSINNIEFNYDNFYGKDKIILPPSARSSEETHRPLARPVLMP